MQESNTNEDLSAIALLLHLDLYELAHVLPTPVFALIMLSSRY